MENFNSSNTTARVTKNPEKTRPYDPILDDPISSGSEEEVKEVAEDESGSSEEEVDFPRENASSLMTFLHREITNLQNLEDAHKRKFALLRLYEIFVLSKNKASKAVY
jgi:hypothetical protein